MTPYLRFLLFPLCVSASFSLAQAADALPADVAATKAPALAEVVVTATAEPSKIRELPATVQVITSQQIERSGLTTLDQVLERYVPGTGTIQPGGYAAIGIRGFRSYQSASSSLGDHVLILIDGHRIGIGNAMAIPMSNVERIEIVRGPSSVLYGGSAMGGVVNLITKRGKGPASGVLGASYGTWDKRSAEASIAGGLDNDRWGYSIGVRGNASSAYKDGDGNRYRNSGYHNGSIGSTLTFRPDDRTDVSLVAAHQSMFDTGSPGGWYAYGLTPDDKIRNTFTYAALEYDTKLDNDVTLRASLYGNRNRYDYAWDGTWGAGNSTYRADTLGGKLVAGVPIGFLGRLSVGAEYNYMREDLYGSSVSQPNAAYDVAGVFAEHRFTPRHDLTVIWGLRYDIYRERIKDTAGLGLVNADSRTFNHLSWSAGTTWWVLDWLGLRASAATAYVPPTAKNLAGDFWTSGAWGTHYVGNPDLNPEKSLTGELGVELDFDTVRGNVAYFYTKYQDRIVTQTLPDYSYTWSNVGDQRLAGINVSLNYKDSFDIGLTKPFELSLYGNGEFFTERHNRDGATSVAMYVPKYSAVSGVGLGYGMLWLDVNGRFTGEQYQDNFTTYEVTRMGSFTTWNTRLTVRPTKQLGVYLDVSNMTDKQYAYTLDYPMPGRTVSVGFTYNY